MTHLLKRKKTVAVIWILAYIVLLVIPILGNGYILVSVNSAIKNETRNKNSYFLKTLGANIDSVFKEIESSKKMINGIPGISEMATKTQITPQVLYDLSTIGAELQKLSVYDYGRFEKIIYFPAINKVVTNSHYYDADAESDKLKIDSIDYSKMLNYPSNSVITHKFVDSTGKEHTVYQFITVVKQNNGMKYVIGISITDQNMFGKEIDFQKSDIAILKHRGDVYISTDEELTEDMLIDVQDMKPFDTRKIILNGKSAEVSYVESQVLKYTYVHIGHGEYIYSTVRRMMWICIGISLLCIVLMALVLYKLSNWNYVNIKEVMHGLEINFDTTREYDENEYEFIKRQIMENIRHQKNMEFKVDSYMETLREEFIIELLRGSINDENYFNKESERFNLSFSGKYFCVTAICAKDRGILQDKSLKNIYYIIKNIMNDIFQNEEYVCAQYADKLFYIFNFKENIDSTVHLKELLSGCGEMTKMATEISFSSVTSEIAEGIQSLPYLYESVISGLNLSEFYGMEDHVFQEDLKNLGNTFNVEQTEGIENEIMVCIKNGEKERMDNLIERLLTAYVELEHTWVIMGRAYSILNKIQRMIEGLAIGHAKESMEMLNSFNNFDSIESIREFVSEYGVYAMKIVESGGQEKSDLYNAAIEYINKNYTEPNLNVNKVSDKLGVTSIYLAYVVKQNSGVKLSEYIGTLRIEHAKKLLEEKPELRVEEVAQQSGFWQNRSFYNAFKKHTGLTPTQYKMINKNEKGI